MNPANLPVVLDVIALRALPATLGPNYPFIYLAGYSTTGDGGQGIWAWSSSSSATDNTGTIVNPTGNSGNGRWLRQFSGPLHDLWFGVIGDGSTDNSTALQAVEDAASTLGINSIYYPVTPSARNFGTSINSHAGILHRGEAYTLGIAETGTLTLGPCNLNYTGAANTWAFQYQLGIGASPQQAPSWENLNITVNFGNGIRLNNPANGFTDDNTSQGALSGFRLENVYLFADERGGTAFQCSKTLNGSIVNCRKTFFDTGFDFQGSDNMEFRANVCEDGFVTEINATAHGTFGNMLWIKDNTISTPYPNATAHIISTQREIFIVDNYFESQNTTTQGGIVLNAGLSATITGNEIDMQVAQTPNWLVVNGTFCNMTISGNFTTGGIPAPALFNSGTGHKYWYNTAVPVTINGGNNTGGDAGIPFFSQTNTNAFNRDYPPVIGQSFWTFNPTLSGLDSTDPYYTSVLVNPGICAWALPAATSLGTQIHFTPQGIPRSLTATVDIWVLAYTSIVNTTLSLVQGSTTTTQALTTSPAWYKMSSAVSVSGLTGLSVYNGDTTNNGIIYVGEIRVVREA